MTWLVSLHTPGDDEGVFDHAVEVDAASAWDAKLWATLENHAWIVTGAVRIE